MKRDFEFISLLLEQFFKQSHIQKRLELIEYREITGWEIWLQIELSIFLEGHIEVAEWDREFKYSIDKRSARHREHMAIDFVIRRKRAALEQYIALEIKQNLNMSSCIRGMMEDTCKVSLVKGSENDLRSMWTIGIHPMTAQDELMDVINDYAEKYNVELLQNCITSTPIKRTKLAYTVF